MSRRLISTLVAVVVLSTAVPAALANSRWPSRATPLSSTLGWFKAINAHDRSKLLFYVAASAKDQMGWARPSVAWSKFTHLHCKTRKVSGRTSADVRCTFHESASPTEGNPDNFWDVYLVHSRAGWLINNYGQG